MVCSARCLAIARALYCARAALYAVKSRDAPRTAARQSGQRSQKVGAQGPPRSGADAQRRAASLGQARSQSSMSTARPDSVAWPARRLEALARDLGEEAVDRLLDVHAEHRIVVPAHADVGDEGRAVRQHAIVGGRRMRVRADDRGRAPVDEIAQRLLLARRLGVEVDEDGVGALLETAGRRAQHRSPGTDRRARA